MSGDGAEIDSTEALPPNTIYTLLAHEHRRAVVRALEPASSTERALVELADDICASRTEEPDDDDRRRLATTLHHSHLPMLANHGIITYDPERRMIGTTQALAELESHLPE